MYLVLLTLLRTVWMGYMLVYVTVLVILSYGEKKSEAATRCFLWEKVFLEMSQNSKENTCASAWNFIKKEALGQVFFCEFSKISKNTFSYRTPPVAVSKKFL